MLAEPSQDALQQLPKVEPLQASDSAPPRAGSWHIWEAEMRQELVSKALVFARNQAVAESERLARVTAAAGRQD